MVPTFSGRRSPGAVLVAAALLLAALVALPVADAIAQTKAEVYGFAMLDMGYQTKQNDPAWFDVVRPTKLPSVDNEFGEDGRFFSGVRQSRLGVKTWTQTDMGELMTQFEFELYGVGVDAGQTTFRLRHAYGQLGKFGAGQTWSPFMDIDVFPNSLEYWGPSGMVFFRNVQFRYMPIQGDTRLTFAIERPGASGDQGDYAGAEALSDVEGRLPLPDFSAEYRRGASWGYVEAAGILRYINWDDTDTEDGTDLSGNTVGWGVNLSSNIKTGERGTLRLQAVYGEGIANYMNDATFDVGVVAQPGNASKPFDGETLPVLGLVGFYDINWNSKWTSSVGYSMIDIDNIDDADNGNTSPRTFQTGHYALANLLHSPVKNFMVGGEVQYGKRENFNGYTSDDLRFQFSAKYNFSTTFGGQ